MPLTSTPEGDWGSSLRVLVVDEDAQHREFAAAAVRSAGVANEVVEAGTAAEALDLAARERFDAILLEHGLPDSDGFETLSAMRARDVDAPIVILTAQGDEETAVRLLKSGAADYLAKAQLTPDRLVRTLRAAVRLHRFEETAAAAKRALVESEARLAKAQQLAHVGSWEIDVVTGRATWSDESFRIFGHAPRAFAPTYEAYLRAVHADDREAVAAKLATSRWDGWPVEFSCRIVRPDGAIRVVATQVEPVRRGSGNVERLLGTVQDVTEGHHAESALRESEERFRQLAANVDVVFWMTSLETGSIVYVNPAYERIWGREVESLHANPRESFEAILPEDRPRVAAAMVALARTGVPYDVEFRIARPDGTLRFVRERGFPVKGENGRVSRLAGIAEDVTQARRAREELEASRRQIMMTEKLSALGTLVSGVAHEIRTPLTYIATSLVLLRRRLAAAAEGDPSAAVLVKETEPLTAGALEGVERINRLVRDLKPFASAAPAERSRVSLATIVASALDLFRATHRGDVAIEAALAPTPEVDCDAGQLQRVIINLLANGAEAMGGGGRLRVSTRTVPEGAQITIEDEGRGIPEDVQARMFDPFFTTKADGTGLGLAITRRIVEAHGGTVSYDTRPGEGTRFHVLLPAAPAGDEEESTRIDVAPAAR